jgi:hypothetical protein
LLHAVQNIYVIMRTAVPKAHYSTITKTARP